MNRKIWLSISLIVLVLIAVACGKAENKSAPASAGNKENVSTTNGHASNTEQLQNSKGEVRIYKHMFGETEIPDKPERVVTLQYTSQMLSVGLKPIGASSHLLETDDPAFKGIGDIGSAEINYEKILALQPELIIAGDVEQDVYDKLSKIAPTVVVPWMEYDVFGHVKVMGEILNRQAEAAEWQKQFDAKIQEAKSKIVGKIGADKTVAIYRIDPKQIYVYGVRNVGFTFYKALDLPHPDIVQKEIDKDPNLWALPVSLEVLPDYAADYVFVMLLDGEEAKTSFDEIKNSAIWKSLPAVKENHVFNISMDTWLGYTPHDIDVQLDEAVRLLTE